MLWESSGFRMLNIYLIRHAQSFANANTRDLIGQPNDVALTDLGIRQAELLAKRFTDDDIKFDIIHSSIYKRAWQTAKILQDKTKYNKDILYTDALIEYDCGDFRGKKRIDILNKYALPMLNLNMGFQIPGGETLHRAERRAATWLENKIIYNDKLKDDANIAIVSHGILIKTILHYILGFEQKFVWKISLYNTGICKLQYHRAEGWHICSINDVGHLRSL
jgi:broad specificity phosphatase PhoE